MGHYDLPLHILGGRSGPGSQCRFCILPVLAALYLAGIDCMIKGSSGCIYMYAFLMPSQLLCARSIGLLHILMVDVIPKRIQSQSSFSLLTIPSHLHCHLSCPRSLTSTGEEYLSATVLCSILVSLFPT